jgi:hypothetical protein
MIEQIDVRAVDVSFDSLEWPYLKGQLLIENDIPVSWDLDLAGISRLSDEICQAAIGAPVGGCFNEFSPELFHFKTLVGGSNYQHIYLHYSQDILTKVEVMPTRSDPLLTWPSQMATHAPEPSVSWLLIFGSLLILLAKKSKSWLSFRQ